MTAPPEFSPEFSPESSPESSPEFSRRVPLARIGSEGFRQVIEATPDERHELALRFGLIDLDRLTATVALRRQSGGTIALDATFEAEFAQECVVTLEPLRGTLSQSFEMVYGPGGEAEAEIELRADEIAFESLDGNAIDIGEAVAQELSLALPPFPRDPEAMLDPTAAAEPEESVFSALARWRERRQQ